MAETGNIKTFESSNDKLTPSSVGAEAYEMMGRHVEATYASAGQKIGGAVATVGEQMEQHDTVMQTADLMKNMSDLEIQAHQNMLAAKNTMDIHDPDAVNKFMGDFNDQLSQIKNQTYTSKAYDAMTRMTSDFDTRARQNFTSYQSEAQANDTMAKLNQSTTTFSNLANRDPNYVKPAIDAINTMADTLPAEHREQYKLQHTQEVYNSSGEGIVGRVEGMKVYDPNAVAQAQAYINDPKNGYVDGMSAPKYAELQNRLDNVRRTGANQTIAGVTLNSGAMLKNISLNGTVPDELSSQIGQLKTINTPEANAKAAELTQGILDSQGEYHGRQVVSSLPADQLSSAKDLLHDVVLAPNKTGSQIAVTQATEKAIDPLLKERHEAFYGNDPIKQGQWNIDNNPAVRQAYDAWRANPTPDTFLTYYQKSLGNQRYLEPGALPSVITDDIANDAHKIQNEILHDPKAGPMQAAADLQGMAKMYGPAWPSIAGDLAKKGIFNGSQLIAAQMTDPTQAGYRSQLLIASATPDKELNERMPAEKARNLVRPEVDALFKSMGNINNAPELEDIYVNSAAKIVQLNGLDDASKLVKTMYLDKFQFVGDGSTIRLDAGVPNGDAIGSGARSVLHDIGNHELVIPPSSRLGSVNQKEAWQDSVKANGVWYTSRDGQSATLYDGPDTRQPVMEVRNGKQVPVQLPFAELARLGQGSHLAQSEIEAEESHIK